MDRRRIAVIEDEQTIAASLAARLRSEGFEVETAVDGLEGVELCGRFRPDLVILDLMLPGLDGLEVCRRIQRDRHVPVLMLTARDSEADVELGLAVGGDDYLTKPFSPRELVARVRALLRRVERAPAPSGDAIRLGKLLIDPAAREVTLDERGRAPDADRVRPPPPAGEVAARRLRPAPPARGGLGLPDRRRRAHGRLARPRAPPQARPRRHPHGARRRLRAEQERLGVRPLDFLGSIKLKLGVVIVAAVAVTVAVLIYGRPRRGSRRS